ncbi:uncharacterized protein [Nicotiana sylvestris]|uniref:uncharacterized protein n=1 Tax=Nicotiana sylvestris TaxID=4096 RepID=UPI00388C9CC9
MDNCGVTDVGFSGSKFTWSLLIKCFNTNQNNVSYFEFLNLWVNQEGFLDNFKEIWESSIVGYHIWILQSKLKLLSRKLIQWSREEIRDINDLIIKWEGKVQIFEDMDVVTISDNNREESNKAYAEYIKWLSMQESLLKQKTQTRWFDEGDINTRHFHSLLRERRRKQQLNMIKNHRGKWIKKEKKDITSLNYG